MLSGSSSLHISVLSLFEKSSSSVSSSKTTLDDLMSRPRAEDKGEPSIWDGEACSSSL